jgi:hypothetical protein
MYIMKSKGPRIDSLGTPCTLIPNLIQNCSEILEIKYTSIRPNSKTGPLFKCLCYAVHAKNA